MNQTKLPVSILGSAFLLLMAVAQSASADFIDFDGFADGTLVTTPISGVTFSLANATAPSIFDGVSSSRPNSLLNASSFSFFSPPANLTITFSTPVDDLSLEYTFENGNITFTVFQGATSTLVTDLFDLDFSDIETADFSSFENVTALTISSSLAADYYAIDNLTFTPVPEPGSAVIGILGIGSLLVLRRKNPLVRPH